MHLGTSRPLFLLATLAGCTAAATQEGADMTAATVACAAESKALPPYTGDAAGALAAATPTIMAFRSDAYLVTIRGSSIGNNGKTSSGGPQWEVTFYSAASAHEYIGILEGDLGHASCGDYKVKTVKPPMPTPIQSSADVVDKFFTAMNFKKDPKVRVGVEYGIVIHGAEQPREKAWKVSYGVVEVIIDDADNTAVECYAATGKVNCRN
ncbi:MAG: hypothetical protein EXR72_10420 [Myxococcales bacterium]|nr:hypothetical protein [Myxococcales bacterium]